MRPVGSWVRVYAYTHRCRVLLAEPIRSNDLAGTIPSGESSSAILGTLVFFRSGMSRRRAVVETDQGSSNGSLLFFVIMKKKAAESHRLERERTEASPKPTVITPGCADEGP